jgi:uncharacterized membrane protein YphA (DoxX/SURF4 family)
MKAVRHWTWFFARLAVIAFFFVGGWMMHSRDVAEFEAGMGAFDLPVAVLFPVVFFAACTLFSSWRDARRIPSRTLSRPDWFGSFLRFRESHHSFEVFGCAALAAGVGLLLASVIAGEPAVLGSVFFISTGTGILIGVRLAVRLFTPDWRSNKPLQADAASPRG